MNKKTLILSFAFLILSSSVYGASPGTSVFSFLKLNPSARISAYGGVKGFMTVGAEADNPAIIPWLEDRTITFDHMLYLSDTQFTRISYFKPLDDDSGFSGSFGYLGSAMTKTIYDATAALGYTESGSFNFNDILISGAYGKRISPHVTWGASVKLVNESIDSNSSFGAAANASILFYPQWEKYRIGVGVVNLGAPVKGYSMPMGAYLNVLENTNKNFTWGAEVIAYSDTVKEAMAGFEYLLSNALTLRFGYRHPFVNPEYGGSFPRINLTGGLGVSISNFMFDYAWVPYGDLGYTHRVSLGYNFSYTKSMGLESY